nr:hypothetical protein [Kibdelosporangium sp. MJ126-NF4]CTQ94572.1 hypothetical protein [Kibdelosporangium sp. MJ126-NF4]
MSRTASDNEIRSAQRRLSKQYHPDVGDGADEERFRLVRLAYETLIDPDKRARYDLTRPSSRVPRQRQAPRPEQPRTESRASRPYRQYTPDPRRPVRDWTPGPCWKCKWRDGWPRLEVRLEKAGAPPHIVTIPECSSCKTPIPKLPMATADFVVFATALIAAVVVVAGVLVAGVSAVSLGWQATFWASCAALLFGTVPMVVDFRRRIPSGYRRRSTIIVDYVAGYPTISKLVDNGYVIVT